MFSISTLTKLAVAVSGLISTASATFDASSNKNVALYWGQASAGSQDSLATYCESDAADIMILSFMTVFPGTDSIPTLNFASACSDTYTSGLLKCDQIATDIQTCQSLGKKVLLSMGGSSGDYGFSSDSEAEEFAGTLWDLFGEGSADERPFGDAVVDGFDFDIENNDDTGYAALATKLRTYFAEGSKDYYLSAAPQCVYPDASIGDALTNAEFDFAFIQFYNNYCNVDATFNWDTWLDYAENTSPNKDIKLYLGLPASSSAASSGYIDIDTIKSTLDTIGDDSYFGGIMLWDASQAFTNTVDDETFAVAVKDALNDLADTSSSSTSTSSSSKSTSSSSTSTSTSTTSTSTSTSSSTTSSTSSTSPAVVSTTTSSSTGIASTSSTSVPASAPVSSTSTSASAPVVPVVSSSTTVLAPVVSSSTAVETTTLSAINTQVVEVINTKVNTITSTVVVKGASASSSASAVAASTSTSASSVETVSTQTPHIVTSTVVVQPSSPATSAEATTSSTSTFVEVTSNTFTNTVGSTLKTVIVSATSTSTVASSSSTTSASVSGCDSLTGSDKADCLNAQYLAGQFGGSADSCTNGETACSASGEYAICSWGTWVVESCAAGTTCYAATEGDDVYVSCNWPQNQKHKRNVEHAHHDHA